ncbi:MAG: hypothetical protein LW703_15875, partial [Rhodobacter sp.]|nr:hypothetical protein [Rhodobacter sp.]
MPDTARGIAQLLRRIGAEPVARILCGPTNRDHRALEVRPAAAGLPPAPVNPRPARRFAQADITRIEAAIAALIAADPAPGRTRPASCKACPASLRLAAATLLAEAPELGQLEARQIAALA